MVKPTSSTFLATKISISSSLLHGRVALMFPCVHDHAIGSRTCSMHQLVLRLGKQRRSISTHVPMVPKYITHSVSWDSEDLKRRIQMWIPHFNKHPNFFSSGWNINDNYILNIERGISLLSKFCGLLVLFTCFSSRQPSRLQTSFLRVISLLAPSIQHSFSAH
jgi:hypothetical protein